MSRIFIDRPAYHTAAIAAVGLLIIVYALTVFPAFNHNDFMYAVAPSFLGSHTLYEDLEFVQAPGSIWLYGLIFKFVEPTNAYLALRILSLSCLFLAGFFIYRTAVILAGHIAAYLVPLLLISSQFIASIAEEIGNTPLALLFLSAAIFIYFTKPLNITTSALAGLMIGLAASAKLNFALYAIPFGLFLVLDRGLLSREVLSYIVGGVLGSALVWYYLLSRPDNFWFFNVDFHYLTNLARGQSSIDGVIAATIMFAMFAFKSLPQLVLCLVASGGFKASPNGRSFLQIIALLGISLVAALSPLYLAVQYLAASALILCLLSCLAAGMLADRYAQDTVKFWGLVVGIAVMSAMLYGYQRVASSIPAYVNDNIGPVVIRNMRDRIEKVADTYLKASQCPKTALSLSPIPFVGTSFSILPNSATGPFIPRLAAQIKHNAPAFAHLANIEAILSRTRPTAFVVGYYPQYSAERTILRYAQDNGFRAFKLGTLDNDLGNKKERTLFLLIRSVCTTKFGDNDANVDQVLGEIPDWSPLAIYGLDWDQSASARGLNSQ